MTSQLFVSKRGMKKESLMGAVYLSLAASIWGSMYVVSKYVLDFIPPFTLMVLRYSITFVFLFSVLKGTEIKNKTREVISRKDWLLLVWIGFIGYFISISCQFIGTKLSDAHTGALITSATPAFMIIFAYFILKEKLSIRKVTALILANGGVVVVIGWQQNMGNYFWGSIILVGAAVTWALYSVYVKVACRRLSSLTVTVYASLFALVFTMPAMFWELKSQPAYFDSPLIVLGVLYLGVISTAGAFLLWNKGLELMDAGIGSLFFFFQPLVGAFLGWLLLDEKLTINFFCGGILIALGVLTATFQNKRDLERHT